VSRASLARSVYVPLVSTASMFRSTLAGAVALAAIAPSAAAQVPLFESPGSPRVPRGDTPRPSSEFNPAIGFVIDTIADWRRERRSGEGTEDGFDITIRSLELNASAYVDPNAWAYVALVSHDLEAPEVEEAAVVLSGFAERTSVKVGRFFVDFGKQMQHHVESLRTVERPLVLRTFLGEELAGTGAQVDWWTPLGDKTPLRASLAVFGSLIPDHGHEHEEEEEGPRPVSPELKDFDELSFTARITAMTELTDRQTLQFGVSGRFIPEFAFEDEEFGLEQEGLSNTVYGTDLTWGWLDSARERSATVGVEWLHARGDLTAEVDETDPLDPVLLVEDGRANGFYAFADYGFNRRNNVGVQHSRVDWSGGIGADAREWEAYWTHHFTEFRRLRLGVSHLDTDGLGEDLRVYVQFTAYIGPHSHGFTW
jgi:hypothetical protein